MLPWESGNDRAPHSGQNMGPTARYPHLNTALVNLANLRFRTDFEGVGPAVAVELVWDWRLARVYDANMRVLDESVWDGVRTTAGLVKRLGLLMDERMTKEARELSERFPDFQIKSPIDTPAWPTMTSEEEILLQDASIILAEQSVADAAANPDFRLDHLVRATEEARATHNTLESNLAEWLGMFLPSLDIDKHRNSIASAIDISESLEELRNHLDGDDSNVDITSEDWSALASLASTVISANSSLNTLENSTSKLASSHLPSLSLLIGPLLAAKLCTAARGRNRLAMLPASTIQVLGAEKAFFQHLRQGTSPPKHGHIFQHPWICKSPKWMRGSISRMLAAKVAIAVRVDHFGGQPWTSAEVSEVEQKVGQIRARKNRK